MNIAILHFNRLFFSEGDIVEFTMFFFDQFHIMEQGTNSWTNIFTCIHIYVY